MELAITRAGQLAFIKQVRLPGTMILRKTDSEDVIETEVKMKLELNAASWNGLRVTEFIHRQCTLTKHRKGSHMKRIIFPVIMFLAMAMLIGSVMPAFARRSAGVAIDDATITTKVKYELAEDVKFSTLKGIQVDTHRGEVTLTGKVHTDAQKKHAGVVTRKVNGVVKVHNLLAVVPEQ